MKKSTLILLLLFVISGGATIWYLNRPPEKATTLYEAEADFAVKDVDQIGKIFLASRVRGNQLTFTRGEGDNWMVNDSIKAHPLAIRSLLTAIRTLRIKYRPSEAAIENIVKGIAVDQVKTEIYDRSGNLIKSYYVGGETNDARGTYMIMDGSEKPFVMEIPSMTGSFKVRYDLSLLEARDRALFRDEAENINYVSIEYPTQRDKSFIMDLRGDEPSVKPFYKTTNQINRPITPGRIERYLQGFDYTISEVLVRNDEGKAAFEELVPFAKINAGFKDGTSRSIVLYPRETSDVFTGAPVKEVEKFAASVNGEYSFMHITQLVVAKKLFMGYPSFFE